MTIKTDTSAGQEEAPMLILSSDNLHRAAPHMVKVSLALKIPCVRSSQNESPSMQTRKVQIALLLLSLTISCLIPSSHRVRAARMVRLCIASVDPAKLSSQCVMCNRREFPLTVIDCTGINRVNDLIANPLSVQEATCLIYNCRKVSSSS